MRLRGKWLALGGLMPLVLLGVLGERPDWIAMLPGLAVVAFGLGLELWRLVILTRRRQANPWRR